ncbi:TfoX/Sxy family protein [Robiginitalea sediminis]|uniref:TfoX/Sxy family protein n=1 Tax=Robiginitalea sediminis TaxID=1982593 RepID=UPI00117A1BF1|nr:TfoX/Sxy family protein [Robiginitalea sediminis]
MAYDTSLEMRINTLLTRRGDDAYKHMELKKMFGGLAYLYKGKMSIGIIADELMARVPASAMEEALERYGARPMDFTGRTMKEFVQVAPEGLRTEADLTTWIEWGLAHARAKCGEEHQ